eukprot:14101195-Alexandrium_andersonii.AAC.1
MNAPLATSASWRPGRSPSRPCSGADTEPSPASPWRCWPHTFRTSEGMWPSAPAVTISTSAQSSGRSLLDSALACPRLRSSPPDSDSHGRHRSY